MKYIFYTILLTVSIAQTKNAVCQTSHRKFNRIQRVIDKAVEQGLSGVSIYINHPKYGEWESTGGYSNLEKKEILGTHHILSLASVGKTYAATAAMLMYEEGLLDLDKKISNYLPEEIIKGIPHAQEVTVRQLMNMTSGFYNYSKSPELNEDYLTGKLKLDTTKHIEVLRKYVYGKTSSLPGERYGYSSTNYMLMALIMNKQLGYSHEEYYRKKIFEPLGLKNTYYRKTPPENFAQHYGDLSDDGNLENLTEQTLVTANWFMGDDGVYATASDVGRFMEALNTGKIVNNASWQEMTDWVMPKDQDYGLGLMTDKNILYRRIIGHSGVALAATADVFYLPYQKITIALLSNTGKRNGDVKFKKLYNKMRSRIVMKLLL